MRGILLSLDGTKNVVPEGEKHEEMEIKDTSSLLENINRGKSVLFLGQNYLASRMGRNPFLDAVNDEMCGGALGDFPDYFKLGEFFKGAPSETDIERMSEIAAAIPEQPWLRRILTLGWNMVYTSAIDDAIFRRVGGDFSLTPIGMDEKKFKGEFASARDRCLHCAYLFGRLETGDSKNDAIPRDWSPKGLSYSVNMKDAKDKITWLRSEDALLAQYGVLVIDGWDPRADWIDAERLVLDIALSGRARIYLFGASREILDDEIIKKYTGEGVITAERRTFAEVLDEFGMFADCEDEDYFISPEYDKDFLTVTIDSGGRREVRRVSEKETMALGRDIKLLDDETEEPVVIEKRYRERRLFDFLRQDAMPVWGYFNDRVNFYFERDKDRELLSAVDGQLKIKKNDASRLVLLEGASNSGKSAMLANLAMTLKRRRQYPVFFIGGTEQYEFGNLEKLI
ncbi:MAG: hypothetical protein LBS53_14330, partial [Synergistaceae bacterium]|nr:hypothetical protein [Synergistaceae bacterium]